MASASMSAFSCIQAPSVCGVNQARLAPLRAPFPWSGPTSRAEPCSRRKSTNLHAGHTVPPKVLSAPTGVAIEVIGAP